MKYHLILTIIWKFIIILDIIVGVGILLILIIINLITVTLSISLDLVFGEVNYIDFIIKKPEWCNSANLIAYYIVLDFQKEYKYPCAQFI